MADELRSKLRLRVRSYAGSITKRATANLGRYVSFISIQSKVDESGRKIGIVSTATSVNPLKPVARAYEYGSGIHSQSSKQSKWQQGVRGRILITPKRKKVLAFYWDKVDEGTPPGRKFRGISKKSGKALFSFVEHPGVQAANGGRGYLRPAVNEVRRNMNAELKEMMGDAYRTTIKTAFRRIK